jgi:hypothetical protein
LRDAVAAFNNPVVRENLTGVKEPSTVATLLTTNSYYTNPVDIVKDNRKDSTLWPTAAIEGSKDSSPGVNLNIAANRVVHC